MKDQDLSTLRAITETTAPDSEIAACDSLGFILAQNLLTAYTVGKYLLPPSKIQKVVAEYLFRSTPSELENGIWIVALKNGTYCLLESWSIEDDAAYGDFGLELTHANTLDDCLNLPLKVKEYLNSTLTEDFKKHKLRQSIEKIKRQEIQDEITI